MKQSLVLALCGVVGPASVARADDVAIELRAIAARLPTKDDMRVAPVASQGCVAPTQTERTDAKKRVFAWIDAKHPDERGVTTSSPDDAGLVVTFGCKDSSGAIVLDISQDREPAKPGPNAFGTRRNYLLRVATAIDVVAEDTSTFSPNWMEWADMGRIRLLAQIDLDGDRALDVVYSDHEHEGGAIGSDDFIHVRYASGTLGESAQIKNLVDVKLVKNQLVVAGQTGSDDRVFYACLRRDLHVAPCPGSTPLQRAADRRSIVARYLRADPSEVPDRELLAQELTTLGVPSKRKAWFYAAARETTPSERAQRRVTAFLVKANLVEPAPMPELVTQSHADARTYLDDLAKKLGDTPCTATPLTDAERTKATAWVKKQDEKAADVMIDASACGPYMWIAWSPTRNDGKRRVVLFGRDGTTRILGYTYEAMMPYEGPSYSEKWFTHDGTIVGIAIANQNLWVIANDKAVAQSKGDRLEFYRYDDRWQEISSNIFVDGGTLWHATPTGREKLDPALVREHEARRAAIALLLQEPVSGNARYLAALQLLGADKALVAECKKLP